MPDVAFRGIELAVLALTFLWAAHRPTMTKVITAIVALSAAGFAAICVAAAQQGTDPFQWYEAFLLDSLNTLPADTGAAQRQMLEGMAHTFALCLPALCFVESASEVFFVFCLRWLFEKAARRRTWAPFSQVDLPIWTVYPLIGGIVLYVVAILPGVSYANVVHAIAFNVLVAAVVPLFVQGAAAGKGILNRIGMSFGWQVALGLVGILSGGLFFVLPLLGLVDYWANVRKLKRDDDTSRSSLRR